MYMDINKSKICENTNIQQQWFLLEDKDNSLAVMIV